MTPSDHLATVSAELQRCDDLLATLWHHDSRAMVGARRIACLRLARLIASEHGLAFDWPTVHPHPRSGRLRPS